MRRQLEEGLERPRAFLAPCILLLLAEAPGHGYELTQRLKALGFDWTGTSAVYRELRALEAAELVRSTWSVPKTGPVPRVYQLTPSGRETLERSAASMVELQSVTGEYLTRFCKLTETSPSTSSSTTTSPRHGECR